ncbi:hypothetical protein L2E82_47985 [Cichorium intybus]|uniref:Uncharacterized protein n=1 Tax=Cichorium intybus TaxID=13427 RepID=A0ACB8YY42_CICIN|nr:hypothetical protein L2E82_47985 [Cichorium intybus]
MNRYRNAGEILGVNETVVGVHVAYSFKQYKDSAALTSVGILPETIVYQKKQRVLVVVGLDYFVRSTDEIKPRNIG